MKGGIHGQHRGPVTHQIENSFGELIGSYILRPNTLGMATNAEDRMSASAASKEIPTVI